MTAQTEPARSGNAVILALAAIAALGSMAIHMLVPALPQLARDLRLEAGDAQLAVSVYLAGLGAGQLLAGPAVDRIGRRPVLLAGIAAYVLGALGSALAPALPWLLAARLLQALGGAAGVVTARVMVGDLFGREEQARRQATLMMVVLISPSVAPVVGGLLADLGGWRLIPGMLGVSALAALAIALPMLPATRAAPPASARPFMPDLLRLLRNRQFLAVTLTLAGGSSTLYLFLSSAAFLLHDFGLSESQSGLCFLVVAATSIAGTRLVGPLGRRTDAVLAGVGLILSGATIELALALVGVTGPAALIAPMMLVGLGAGVVGPSAISILLYVEEGLAGTATSIAGATQMLASGVATVAFAQFAPVSPLRLAIALAIAASGAFAGAIARRS
ncbi:Bcr/CflA family efflux MFS transporter [Novosphingobium sp.]|mgnify:CR=1 FL=1|uniref:Bcr/CflA family efflux MFS transporter n=1 Tax=Novosphingobium sp. TaxID=1874826 RepID=UPI001EBD0526|nr:Bcr/CflA family efflux MFS transporter [Novosphingobium sp.]MBK6802232.1 Bcr/CflA family efflux MFS transporter [Novosphingobium sp.]MBK9009713.1 Bcr/CflA family efflux MFS transporter [Novosphingobium sp.]